jgi:hypothetical protein
MNLAELAASSVDFMVLHYADMVKRHPEFTLVCARLQIRWKSGSLLCCTLIDGNGGGCLAHSNTWRLCSRRETTSQDRM